VRLAADVFYAIVPEWVVMHPHLSDRAVRLYAVLRRKADHDSLVAWPSRSWLAETLNNCSLDSVDRAVKELIGVGALSRELRRTADGQQATSLYLLHTTPNTDEKTAPVRQVGRKSAAHVGRNTAALIEDSEEDSQKSPQPFLPVGTEAAPRDSLFEAVVEACGWDMNGLTPQARGWIDSALPALRQIRASPDEVRWKARVYRANYDGKHPTPSALAKHWAALTEKSLERVDRRQLDRELAQRYSEAQLRQALEAP